MAPGIRRRSYSLLPIAHHRELHRRHQEDPAKGARAFSFDFWKVSPRSVAFSSVDTHVICSLKRGPDGRFKDTELAAIIKNAFVTFLAFVR
jgi:hypothetical protein